MSEIDWETAKKQIDELLTSLDLPPGKHVRGRFAPVPVEMKLLVTTIKLVMSEIEKLRGQ